MVARVDRFLAELVDLVLGGVAAWFWRATQIMPLTRWTDPPPMPVSLTDEQIAEMRAHRAYRRAPGGRTRPRGHLMHSIAKELGWSATALYRYFADKDAILAAARTAALDRLSDRLEAALAGPAICGSRSRAIGNAYVDFALGNPDAYKLVFALSQPDAAQYPALAAALVPSRGTMTRYVELMVEHGLLDGDPDLLGHLFRPVDGLISLHMAGQLGPDRRPSPRCAMRWSAVLPRARSRLAGIVSG